MMTGGPRTAQRRAAILATSLVAVLLLAAPARAQTLCSAPIAPFCIEAQSTYDDPGATDRCRQDLDAYKAQVDNYAACLAQKIAELRDEQAALEAGFTCRAEGGEGCPTTDPLD